MDLRIIAVEALPDFMVRLSFTNGLVKVVDMNPVIAEGGAFSALSDAQLFSAPEIRQDGHYVEWPGGLDFGADTLYDLGITVAEIPGRRSA